MTTTVTMQLNTADHAGDWANRPAAKAQTGTGTLGAWNRSVHMTKADELAVRMSDLRGTVEAMQTGAHSPTLADSSTGTAAVEFGAPALYCGMRFDLDVV